MSKRFRLNDHLPDQDQNQNQRRDLFLLHKFKLNRANNLEKPLLKLLPKLLLKPQQKPQKKLSVA